MAARAAVGRLPEYVHVYFHDTDLLDSRRRAALAIGLAVLGRRHIRSDLGILAGLRVPDAVARLE